ncbi:MAG: SRPBCC domain-containing protein [Planctomycetaceae bacterium]|nr:SRPBCC domain-containing protein [Planctomycetaceae bacterium]
MSSLDDLSLEIFQTIEINTSIGDAYKALLRRLTTESSTPDNRPMPMVLEEWPGGRWFRDLGAGQGHLWGFVQVIKPPTLIEIHGPMFMSYAVAGHIQVRLTPISGGVELSLHHRVLGQVEEEHRQGVVPGWAWMLEKTKEIAERSSSE